MEQQKLNLKNYSFREALQEWDWTKNDQNVLQNYTTVAVGRNVLPICLNYSNRNHASLTCDVQTRLLMLVVTLQRLCRQSKVKWKLEASISQTLRSSIRKPVSLAQLAILGKLIYNFFSFFCLEIVSMVNLRLRNISGVFILHLYTRWDHWGKACVGGLRLLWHIRPPHVCCWSSHTVWGSGARTG